MEDASEGFEESKGVGTDGFDAEFGFEDFDVGLGGAEEPGGEALGVFFGKDFGEVVVGHFDRLWRKRSYRSQRFSPEYQY